jgi:hypothetical protein
MTLPARFWAKVDKNGECWEWTGSRQGNGYGRFRTVGGRQGRTDYAHRLAALDALGPVPDGMEVCHRCDNRRCVRPDHLFYGTRTDNVRDCMAKGRFSPPPNRWAVR